MFGRKKMLFAIGILYVLGALGTALTSDHTIFMIFRFLGGVGVGAASVCAPIYTAEIAPPAVRGRLVGLVQFNIVLGILLAYGSNAIIAAIAPPRRCLAMDVRRHGRPGRGFPAAVDHCAGDTPLVVVRRPRPGGRGRPPPTVHHRTKRPEFELEEIHASLAAAENAKDVPFFTPQHRKVILLAIAIAAFNQLSGINAILYYAPEVMKSAGASGNAALWMSVGVGL